MLKVSKGSNKAGCFLEVAVFFEGGRKGVIKLPEGHGGWGWRRYVDELRHLLALVVAKATPMVPGVISGVVGNPSDQSLAAVSWKLRHRWRFALSKGGSFLWVAASQR